MNSTNFPDFSSYEQDQFDFSQNVPAQQPITPQTQTSEMERFWTATGNWGEFGLYFGLGLSASLMVRAIPVLQPSAVILVPAIAGSLALMSAIAPAEDRLRYQLILIATAAALIGGNYDAWLEWLAANAWKIGASMLLIGAAIYLIPMVGGKKSV